MLKLGQDVIIYLTTKSQTHPFEVAERKSII